MVQCAATVPLSLPIGAVLPRGSLRCAKPVLWVGCQGAEVKAVAKFLSVARQVRQFYTAPTLVRALEAQDDHFVTDHDRSSLRILGTVGEPINPRAWLWFFKVSTLRPLPTCMSADDAPLLLGSFALGDCNLAAPPDGVAPLSLSLVRSHHDRHRCHSGDCDMSWHADCGRRALPHCGHLVADGDGHRHDCPPARRLALRARLCHPALLRRAASPPG